MAMGPIPYYGDHIPISEFEECVKNRLFIDYDGSGYYASATEMSDERFVPSTFKNLYPKYTHVVWFNR